MRNTAIFKFFNLPLLVALIILFSACGRGEKDEETKLSKITVATTRSSPFVSDEFQLTAIASYSDTTTADVTLSSTWASSNQEIATISTKGKVNFLSQGEVIITAEFGGKTGDHKFTVSPLPTLSEITIANPLTAVTETNVLTLKAIGIFSDQTTIETPEIFTWSSSDEEIAVVDNTEGKHGELTAKKFGTVTITASSGETKATLDITIQPAITGLSMEEKTLYLQIGGEAFIEVRANLSDGSNKIITDSVTWSYSITDTNTQEKEVLEIQRSGNIILHKPGTTTVTATHVFNNLEFQISRMIVVEEPLNLFVVNDINQTINLKWLAVKNASEYKIYWSNTANETRENANAVSITDKDKTTFIHENVDKIKTYYYRLSFIRNETESELSDEIAVRAHAGQWRNKQKLQPLTANATSVVQNDSIIMFGGFEYSIVEDTENTNNDFIITGAVSTKVREYNFLKDEWTPLTSLVPARQSATACVHSGKVFVIGGLDEDAKPLSLGTISVYDIQSKTWTDIQTILNGIDSLDTTLLGQSSCNIIDDQFFIVGGKNADSAQNTLYSFSLPVDTESTDPLNITALRTMNSPRYNHSSVIHNGKIYVAGGNNDVDVLSTVEVYNPTDNSWSNLPAMSTSRQNFKMFTYGDLIYAVGGLNTLPVLKTEFYDIVNNSWQSSINMPFANHSFFAEVYNNTLYTFGGEARSYINSGFAADQMQFNLQDNTWYPHPPAPSTSPQGVRDYTSAVINDSLYLIGGNTGSQTTVNNVELFNFKLNKWNVDADGNEYHPDTMEFPRAGATAVTYKNRIYVLGGLNDTTYLDTIEIYNPNDNLWSISSGALSDSRSELCAVVFDEQIYIFGGRDSRGEVTTYERYDPIINKSTILGNMVPRTGAGCAVINDRIYLVGGAKYNASNNTYEATDSLRAYIPAVNRWENLPNIVNENKENSIIRPAVSVLNNLLYVFGGFPNSYRLPRQSNDKASRFIPAENTWRNLIGENEDKILFKLPSPLDNITSQVYKNKIYIVGGDSINNADALIQNNVYVFE